MSSQAGLPLHAIVHLYESQLFMVVLPLLASLLFQQVFVGVFAAGQHSSANVPKTEQVTACQSLFCHNAHVVHKAAGHNSEEHWRQNVGISLHCNHCGETSSVHTWHFALQGHPAQTSPVEGTTGRPAHSLPKSHGTMDVVTTRAWILSSTQSTGTKCFETWEKTARKE